MHLLSAINLTNAVEQKDFSRWLIKLCESCFFTIKLKKDTIQLSANIVSQFQKLNNLIHTIYSDFSSNSNTILTPKNNYVNTINTTIIF